MPALHCEDGVRVEQVRGREASAAHAWARAWCDRLLGYVAPTGAQGAGGGRSTHQPTHTAAAGGARMTLSALSALSSASCLHCRTPLCRPTWCRHIILPLTHLPAVHSTASCCARLCHSRTTGRRGGDKGGPALGGSETSHRDRAARCATVWRRVLQLPSAVVG